MVDVIDNKWQNGELFSCPREKIDDLLAKPEINRYGVYLLISQDKVYVGQSSNLKARITQHIVGKDWWERAVVLTTQNDSFNKSDIDYLESVLIQKSTACGTLDSDNKNKGNKKKLINLGSRLWMNMSKRPCSFFSLLVFLCSRPRITSHRSLKRFLQPIRQQWN